MSDLASQHKQLKDPRSRGQIHPQHYTSDSGDDCADVCEDMPLTESNMPAQAHIMSPGHMIKLSALSANDGLSFCQTLCTAHDPLKGH